MAFYAGFLNWSVYFKRISLIGYGRFRKWLIIDVFYATKHLLLKKQKQKKKWSFIYAGCKYRFSVAWKVNHFCRFWLFKEVILFCLYFANRGIHFFPGPFFCHILIYAFQYNFFPIFICKAIVFYEFVCVFSLLHHVFEKKKIADIKKKKTVLFLKKKKKYKNRAFFHDLFVRRGFYPHPVYVWHYVSLW